MAWQARCKEIAYICVDFVKLPAKGRPKYDSITKHFYTPSSTVEAEKALRAAWIERYGADKGAFLGPVTVEITARREVAKREPKKNTGRAVLMKPDVDNVAKLVLDALSGTAWHDDEQVTSLHITRLEQGDPGQEAWLFVTVRYYDEREVIA